MLFYILMCELLVKYNGVLWVTYNKKEKWCRHVITDFQYKFQYNNVFFKKKKFQEDNNKKKKKKSSG